MAPPPAAPLGNRSYISAEVASELWSAVKCGASACQYVSRSLRLPFFSVTATALFLLSTIILSISDWSYKYSCQCKYHVYSTSTERLQTIHYRLLFLKCTLDVIITDLVRYVSG